VTFGYSGTVNSDYGSINGNTATHAGVYTLSISAVNNANYALPATAPSVTFTITPRPLSLAFNSVNATYDGNEHGIDLTVGNIVASDLSSFTSDKFTLSNAGCTVSDGASNGKYYIYFRAISAGTYDVGVSAFGNTDYSLTPANGNFEIKRKEITVSGWNWSDGVDSGSGVYSFVYNGKTFTLTPVAGGLVGAESVTLTVSNNTGVNATDYAARASLDEDVYTNYTMSPVTQPWTITKKEIGITWALDGNASFSLTYDGTNHTITAVATGLIGTDETGITLDGNVTEKSAGSYTAKATAVSNGNYKLPSEVTKSWSIEQRTVALAWKLDGENKRAVEYDSEVHSVAATVTNIATGDSLAVTLTGNYSATGKGSYTATASAITGTGSANYTLDGVANVDGARYYEWKIMAIVLDVSFNGGSFNYDGSLQGITATITKITNSDLNNDSVGFGTAGTTSGVTVTTDKDELKYYVTFKAVNAGAYDAAISSISGVSAANYELPANASSSFVIVKRIITVSWTAEGGVYNATEYSATATVTNVVAGDTLVLSYNTTGNANAYSSGTNTAKRADSYTTTITGVDDENYTVAGATNVSVVWSIAPKVLTDFSWSENIFTYDATTKTVIATVNTESVGSGDVNDGKAYEVDSVSFTYSGTVTTDYGISSVVGNSAVNAGIYNVSVSGVNNTDYSVGDVSCSLTVNKVTLSSSLTIDREFGYDGKEHGITVTVSGIVAENNNNTELYLISSFVGNVGNAIRTGTQFTQFFGAIDADTYYLTATLGGAKKDNYILADLDTSFIVKPREITTAITANVTTDKLVYSAREISDGDLGITFSNVVTGESLALDADYIVSYKNSSDEAMASNPINVGTYTATVSLKNSVRAGNYLLTGTTSFEFAITYYAISVSDLVWSLGGTVINIEGLSYVADESKTVVVSAIDDEVFNRAGGLTGMSFGYVYFGFCNCGAEATSSGSCEHVDHQWLTANNGVGPTHAGTYWVVLSLTGGNSGNFVLEGFENYTDANHFAEEGGRTYLTWYGGASKAIETALPVLGNTVVAKQFGVARSAQGITIDFDNGSLPYKGSYYTVTDGLPAATGMGEGAVIKVSVNSVEYAYDTYASESFAVVKNAGTYDIQIWDANATGTITSCDTFSEDAQISYAVMLEITKSKITLTAGGATAWTKKYDKTAAYTTFDYTGRTTQVEYVKGVETDGVITGTSVNISGAFGNWNAGSRELIFTLGGADASNYYLVLNNGTSDLTQDADYTVSGNTYTVKGGTATNNVSNGDGGYIEPRIITVVGDTDKVYDGTTSLANFEITSQDIVSGDSVTVTGIYASANVGTWDITLSTDNINYVISSSVGAQGTISKAPVTFTWTNNGASYEYDKLPHGVQVAVSGMVSGHEESIVVSGSETDTFSGNVTKTYVSTAAGSYTVALALVNGENSNYTIEAATTTGRWTITPKTVTIVWTKDNLADGLHIYDWNSYNVVYSNTQRSVTPSVTGIIDGDSVGITTSGTKGTDVGDYVSAVTSLTGADKDNYSLPAVTERSWSIIKASITNLSISGATFTYNKGVNGLTVNTTMSQHGVPLNVVYGGGTTKTAVTITGENAAINAGTYTITASVAETTNYNAWSASAVLTIDKAVISGITMTGENVIYDKNPHVVSVSTTTTSLGDSVSVAYRITGTTSGGIDVDETGNSAVNAGEYTVTATLTDENDNYIEKVLTATLNIATRAI
ncbi:MAG: YDG domain-containing protein, partial [Christensenellales bacterium]